MRYTNVYALASPDGLTLIDAGYDHPASWDALCDGLVEAGYSIRDVRRVLVTHAHRDHHGQAARVRRESGAWVAMHPHEAATLPARLGPMEVLRERQLAWLRQCGVPDADAPDMMPLVFQADGIDASEPDILLDDGDRVPAPGWKLRAVWTPGHTPGHLTFYEEQHGLLHSGDHILPRITPNISANLRQSPNPLGDYLWHLDKLADLAVDEVLPAHEYRFRGLADRIAQLRRHHEARLDQVRQSVAAHPGSTAWQVSATLTWARPWSQTPPLLRRLALGETLSHLIVLAERGQVIARRVDDIEVWRLAPRARSGQEP